ncbi:hypothetical protein VUR80DRAFT_8321 [Thermomyces stellatus]
MLMATSTPIFSRLVILRFQMIFHGNIESTRSIAPEYATPPTCQLSLSLSSRSEQVRRTLQLTRRKHKIPDLHQRVDVKEHHDGAAPHDCRHRHDDGPDAPQDPPIRDAREGQREGDLAPHGGPHGEEARHVGQRGHLLEVGGLDGLKRAAVAVRDGDGRHDGRDHEGELRACAVSNSTLVKTNVGGSLGEGAWKGRGLGVLCLGICVVTGERVTLVAMPRAEGNVQEKAEARPYKYQRDWISSIQVS